jgi:hypothetical protein
MTTDRSRIVHAAAEVQSVRSGAMPRVLFMLAATALLCGCRGRDAASACALITADEIATALHTSDVKTDSASGFDPATGIDRCRWTTDGGKSLDLRIYRADSSAESAWSMVFESAKVHAMRPDETGRIRARNVEGVGDDAMFLVGTGSNGSVAFRVGRTGAVVAGDAPEQALVELAKRAAGRM